MPITYATQVSSLSLSQCSLRVSYAFSRASSLALAYMQVQRPRWRLAPLARSLAVSSLDKPLVCEALTSRRIDEAVKARQRVVLDVPFIEAEGELIGITMNVLLPGVMIDADQSALEHGKD